MKIVRLEDGAVLSFPSVPEIRVAFFLLCYSRSLLPGQALIGQMPTGERVEVRLEQLKLDLLSIVTVNPGLG